MLNENSVRNMRRKRRQMSTRKYVKGTTERPRLTVFKSNHHLCAQLIDDETGVTIASAGTLSKEFRNKNLGKRSKEAAREIGMKIAETAKQKNIQKFVFDRGHYKYHGLLAELANAARESGIQF